MSRVYLFCVPMLLPLCVLAQERGDELRLLQREPVAEEAAQDKSEEEPDAPPGYPGRETDHLVPLPKEIPDYRANYEARLDREFKLGEFAFARMIASGGSDDLAGERVVSIHGGPADRDPAKAEKFYLTCKTASPNVWYALAENSDDKLNHEVKVRVITVPLDKPLALRLISLWDRMLDRVEERDWKKFPNGTLDGGHYTFLTPGKSGEYHWAPYNKLSTAIFTKLGEALILYCEEQWMLQHLTVKRVEAQAARLEKYLDEHPAK